MIASTNFNFGELYLVYPRLTVLVGSRLGGRPNIMPASWHTPISSDPPLYGVVISPKRATFRGIRETGGFTVNFLQLDKAGLSEQTGFTSGADTDKFARFSIATGEDSLGFGPVLRDAYCALECRLQDSVSQGDHSILVGLVQVVSYDENLVERYGGHDVLSREARPLLYAGRGLYCTWDPASVVKMRE